MKRTDFTARDVTTAAMSTAVLFGAKEVMAALPNIEPVTLLILLYALTFGRRTLLIIAAFVALELLIYPAGTWWLMYLYAWPLWYFAVRFLARFRPTALLWACAAGVFGLAFGALCLPAHMILMGPAGAFGWWVAGIPMDLCHGAGNFALTLVLFAPLRRLLERLYG